MAPQRPFLGLRHRVFGAGSCHPFSRLPGKSAALRDLGGASHGSWETALARGRWTGPSTSDRGQTLSPRPCPTVPCYGGIVCPRTLPLGALLCPTRPEAGRLPRHAGPHRHGVHLLGPPSLRGFPLRARTGRNLVEAPPPSEGRGHPRPSSSGRRGGGEAWDTPRHGEGPDDLGGGSMGVRLRPPPRALGPSGFERTAPPGTTTVPTGTGSWARTPAGGGLGRPANPHPRAVGAGRG